MTTKCSFKKLTWSKNNFITAVLRLRIEKTENASNDRNNFLIKKNCLKI